MKEQYHNLLVFHSKKQDGNMAKKFSDDAAMNRQNFVEKMGLDISRFLFLQANNGDQVVELKEEVIDCENLYGKLIETDAIICKFPNVYIYLNFGDCIPFTLYDRKQNIFAFAHLGRQSVVLNLHQKLFYIFQNEYHSKVEDLIVHIGPCIKKESYLLKNPDVLKQPEWRDFLTPMGNDIYGLDLSGYICDFFYKQGLKEEQVIVSNIDTGKDENYFSHYRSIHQQEPEGRFFCGAGMIK